MGAGNYSLLSTATEGATITHGDRNAEHQNHINNHNFVALDDYSATNSQMQATTDPYPSSVESLATSGSGELERLRYVVKQMSGEAQWYIDPDTDLATTKLHIDSLNAHYAYVAKTTTYTLTATDHIIAADGTSAAFTVTLPTAVGITGKEYILIKIDASANAITIDGNGSETINGQATYSLITQWDSIILRSNGANWISPARYSQTPTIVDYTNATHTHANAAGGAQITSTGITGALGAWDATKADNTVYQATTDLEVHVYLAAGAASSYGYSQGYTDSSNPPTTIRIAGACHDSATIGAGMKYGGFKMSVKKNDYWKVVKTQTAGTVTQTIYAIPVGS